MLLLENKVEDFKKIYEYKQKMTREEAQKNYTRVNSRNKNLEL